MKHFRQSKRLNPIGIILFICLMGLGLKTVYASDPIHIYYTFYPTADATVAGQYPGSNQGNGPQLRVMGNDMGGDMASYLRFEVIDLAGFVEEATLRLYVESNNASGYAVYYVPDNSWGEYGINYDNAPTLGELIYTSDSENIAAPNSWIEVDVTSYVQVDGVYNFAIVGTDDRLLTFSSREGAFQPELFIDDPAVCIGSCPPFGGSVVE